MPSHHDDRRAEERFPTPPHLDCSFASPVLEDFGKMRITNISRSGIGLITSEEIAAGMLLAIKLTNPTKAFVRAVFVKIVHVKPMVGGAFLIGGTLDPPLSYEEFTACVM